jgi:hypothetical protein
VTLTTSGLWLALLSSASAQVPPGAPEPEPVPASVPAPSPTVPSPTVPSPTVPSPTVPSPTVPVPTVPTIPTVPAPVPEPSSSPALPAASPEADPEAVAEADDGDTGARDLGREIEDLRTLIESDERVVGNLTRMDGAKVRLAGYLDVGFFDAMGDGVSYARDSGKRLFPKHADVPWVFWGDPWANAVNSQGDSADLGLDRTNIARWDPIASGGAPSFLVNMVNQSVLVTYKRSLLLETSVNFEPRDGNDLDRIGAPGDVMDVDLAYAEWIPFEKVNLHLFAGKSDPTFGIEYRGRKASDRFGVTPSLISRYTMQPQTGIKVRGGLFRDFFIYNFALSNGQASTERFGHFYNEIDDNAGKTGSGRLALVLPLPVFLEIGGSGMLGAQDDQPDDNVMHEQLGADVKLRAGDFTFEGEWLFFSRAAGGGSAEAPAIDAKGWYAQARYLVVPGIGVYGRVDRRTAELYASPNLYLSDTLRFTGGVRLDITFNVLVKAEYLHIREVEQPELDNDVFTSSLVLRY